MLYKKLTSFLVFTFFFICIHSQAQSQTPNGEFGEWHVSLMDTNTERFIKLWTNIPNTSTIFEIALTKNKGYRYYEPEDQATVSFIHLIEPVIYKKEYASTNDVKKAGEFSMDEIIYPVGLLNQDSSGDLVSHVYNLPDDFLNLLSDCKILMFRQANGVNYIIPLNGFNEALAYANSLRNDYNDPSKHPCYPLIPINKLKANLNIK